MTTEQERAAFETWRIKHYNYDDLDAFEVNFAFEAFKAGLQSQDREECNWQFDYVEGAYQTDCGNLSIIFDGSPRENRMKFCCYCGSKINEVIDHARRIEKNE